MGDVVSVARRVGVSGSNARVHGESGTGKETVARLVHGEKIRRLREDLPPGRPGQATAGAAP